MPRIHENIRRKEQGRETLRYQADVTHYGCPKPLKFSDSPAGNLELIEQEWWAHEWLSAGYQAKALEELLEEHGNFTEEDFYKRAGLIRYKEQQAREGWL